MTGRTVKLITPFGDRAYTLEGNATDDSVIGAIDRNNGYYEPHLMQLLRQRLAPDAVSLDVGANIGPLTLVMSECSPQGQVYAFEPAAESFDFLQRNLEANGVGNVFPQRLALYDESADLTFSYSPSFAGGSFVNSADYSEGITEQIKAVRLDDWVAEQGLTRLDLVKLDVEGAEMRALAGSRKTIGDMQPDLIIEFNTVTLQRFHDQDPWRLLEVLEELYPRIYYIRGVGQIIRILSRQHLAKVLARSGYVDLFCSFRPPPPVSIRHLRRHEQLRALRDAATVAWEHNRWRPPAKNFVIDPSYQLGFAINELRGRAGELVRLGVHVTNTSRFWYSSTFHEHAVCISYQWFDDEGNMVEYDGIRTFLPKPLAPGKSTAVDIAVQLPLEPGRYMLLVSLVQEHFMWFYKRDPALGPMLPTTVV